MTRKSELKQKDKYRLITLWLTPGQLAELDANANGNRSKFIREALEAYILFGNVHKRS